MTPPTCIFCSRVILELDGQFEVLQGYLLDSTSANVPAGACHSACLITSRWGPAWAERRALHQENVLRHELVAQSGGHRVYRDRRNREWVVVAGTGELIGWRFGAERSARRSATGRLFSIESEFNLELPDMPEVIAEAQAALTQTKGYSLWRCIERLGIADVMRHPEALADGNFVFDRALRSYWSAQAISARVRYAQLVPDDIVALVEGVNMGGQGPLP
jgi:hypothetical protein